MQHNSVTFDRLLTSARATSLTPHKLVGEDLIDWMHRLVNIGKTPFEISLITGVPRNNVDYWMERNGYVVDHS